LFAGSATAVGAGGYYIYSTSTGEQTGKGVIINKSSQTSPRKDLSTTVDDTQKQDQNQENTQEPEKNVEKDLSTTVQEPKKQEQSQEPEKSVETDLSASVDEAQKQGQNQEKSQEPEKNVETDLSASVDEAQKQGQNQEKIQESENDLQKNNNQSIRVGFWNILKYTNKTNSNKQSNSTKTFALATVINTTGSDVVGLAEITTTGDGTDIVKELEKLNPSAGWKQITTDKYGKKYQQEKYTFLYKSSLLETINFEEKSNPYLIQEGINLKEWARPVAAVKFKTKTNIKNDFTLAIGHFDAPGQYRGKNNDRKEKADREASGQGDQEANEARDLVNVLAKIDEKDGPNNEIIFMGDTNILTKNTEKLFESTLKSYRLLLDKDEKTTLSSKNFGEYANSYDKIFYKGDLNTKNAQKYDLYSIFENKIVDLEKYDEMRKQDKRQPKKKLGGPKDIERIKGISDHTMVYFDLELSESDTN
ncbi:MnuA family membrane nuclease, partial [Mesomycoplasma ovipneumoniae]|uniref:endonuclease/exonuclease/phosphatase family protein n=1 Tax=Mesomycoplasma ovipneumoniae TaxID=29562 RepID=UPI003CC7C655